VQRQYVERFTALLVVFTSSDLQNGQAFGGTIAFNRLGVHKDRLSALLIVKTMQARLREDTESTANTPVETENRKPRK
jgi:hypothetical protein